MLAETLLPSSSYGPVMASGITDTSEATPSRQKPDFAAASKLITSESPEDDPFGGTSAATATTGGLVGTAIGFFKEIYRTNSFDKTEVIDFLKENAIAPGSDEVARKGNGRVYLPCPAKKVALPTVAGRDVTLAGALADSDCKSIAHSPRVADYYSFYLPAASRLMVEAKDDGDSTSAFVDAYVYFRDGLGASGTILHQNDNRPSEQTYGRSSDSKLVTDILQPGTYTVEVTAPQSSANLGGYDMVVTVLCTDGCSTETATLEPVLGDNSLRVEGNHVTYTVNSTIPVKMVVNPGTKKALLGMRTPNITANRCNAQNDQTLNLLPKDQFILGACSFGVGRVELRRQDDDLLLQSYNFQIRAAENTSLNPVPINSTFDDSGRWTAFSVRMRQAGKISVHSGTSDIRREVVGAGSLSLTKNQSDDHDCDNPERQDSVDASQTDTVYIAGCAVGEVRIALGNSSADWNYYVVTVRPTSKDSIAAPANLTLSPLTSRLVASWNAVPQADEYEIQWKTNGESFADNTETVPSTLKTLSLAENTSYTVRVRAIMNGKVGQWSSEESATTLAEVVPPTTEPLATPTNITLTALQDGESIRVTWDSVPGAEYYYVGWAEFGQWLLPDWGSRATGTEHTIMGLLPNTRYAVWVTAGREDGLGSARPPTERATTLTSANPPVPLPAPVVTVTPQANHIDLSWPAVDGATMYVAQAGYERAKLLRSSGATSASFHVYSPGTTVMVRGAAFKNSVLGQWSTEQWVNVSNTAPSVPVGLVLDRTGDTITNVSWDESERVGSYTLEWWADGQSANKTAEAANTTGLSLTSLTNGTAYNVRVRAKTEPCARRGRLRKGYSWRPGASR